MDLVNLRRRINASPFLPGSPVDRDEISALLDAAEDSLRFQRDLQSSRNASAVWKFAAKKAEARVIVSERVIEMAHYAVDGRAGWRSELRAALTELEADGRS